MSELKSSSESIDFILTNIVGGGGLWQWFLVFAMWPIAFAAGYPLVLHMFAAFSPRHDNSDFNDQTYTEAPYSLG